MKNNKLISVSVGIAAHNEEKNISRVINQVLLQNRKGWRLQEILVYTDGCTDKTADEVLKLHNNQIHLNNDNKRKGKPQRINQMFKASNSDILITIDADIIFDNNGVFTNIVQQFTNDSNVMLVCADSRPLPPKSFFESSVLSTFSSYYISRDRIADGNTLFGCSGLCLAVKKPFYSSIRLPKLLSNEDDYLYFSCIQQGYTFRLAKGAFVYYRLPSTVKDYVRQQYRSTPQYVTKLLFEKFGMLIEEEYKKSRSKKLLLTSMLQSFIANPIGFLFVSALRTYCALSITFTYYKYTLDKYSATTTKLL